jgi:hypothetical protein
LNIVDHGNQLAIEIGNDSLNRFSIKTFEGALHRLRGHFARPSRLSEGEIRRLTPTDVQTFGHELVAIGGHRVQYRGGFIHLQNCEIGTETEFLHRLAAAVGVYVVAGTGLDRPALGYNTGRYVRVFPQGHWEMGVGRP